MLKIEGKLKGNLPGKIETVWSGNLGIAHAIQTAGTFNSRNLVRFGESESVFGNSKSIAIGACICVFTNLTNRSQVRSIGLVSLKSRV